MIQRIQSIYLFIAAILTSLIYIFPFAEYLKDGTFYLLDIMGLKNNSTSETIFSTLPLLLLVSICILIAFATIFLFNKRTLQIRLCNLNILLYVILIAGVFFYSDRVENELNVESLVTTYKFGSIIPVIGIILTFLANRAIRKDEALVRASDRIR
ncbi:MAG: DUF4293 domain-containing protein [Bacteroidetes bacterium]|nr:DUF4293 domain-containing protein [Bacteroidota bacterium]HET6243057.1 DUF4293 domain-containing protein [Bacteroidia bacterium]